jgi:hypothetical protein
LFVEVHDLSQLDKDLALGHLIHETKETRKRKPIRLANEVLGRSLARKFIPWVDLFVNQAPRQTVEHFSNEWVFLFFFLKVFFCGRCNTESSGGHS